jgi:hypothetical protein
VANPALMVLPLDGSLQGRDRSGVFSAIGAGAVRWKAPPGQRVNLFADPMFEMPSANWWRSGLFVDDATAASTDDGVVRLTVAGPYPYVSMQIRQEVLLGMAPSALTFAFDVRCSASRTVWLDWYTDLDYESVPFPVTTEWQHVVVSMDVVPPDAFFVDMYGGLEVGDWIELRRAVAGIGPEQPFFAGARAADSAFGLLRDVPAAPRSDRVVSVLGAGATNVVPNPYGTSGTGWSGVNCSLRFDMPRGLPGTGGSVFAYSSTGANAEASIGVTASAMTHTAVALVQSFASGTRQLQLVYNGSVIGSPVSASFTRAIVSASFVGTGGAANLGVRMLDSTSGLVNVFDIYALCAYEGSVVPPFFVPSMAGGGALGVGDAWTGTAHNSPSVRTAATISMDEAGRIDPVSGSLAFRYTRLIDTGAAEPILDVGEGTSGKDRLRLRINSSDKLEVSWQSNGASETTLASTESITVGTEYWVYVAWSGTSVWVGIDANALASGTRNAPQNNWGTTDLVVGTTAGSAGFGDLLIADRPLLPAERGAVRGRSPISMGVLAGAPYKHFQLRPY